MINSGQFEQTIARGLPDFVLDWQIGQFRPNSAQLWPVFGRGGHPCSISAQLGPSFANVGPHSTKCGGTSALCFPECPNADTKVGQNQNTNRVERSHCQARSDRERERERGGHDGLGGLKSRWGIPLDWASQRSELHEHRRHLHHLMRRIRGVHVKTPIQVGLGTVGSGPCHRKQWCRWRRCSSKPELYEANSCDVLPPPPGRGDRSLRSSALVADPGSRS